MKTSEIRCQESLTLGDWVRRFYLSSCAVDTLECGREFAHHRGGFASVDDPFQTILSLARMEVEQRFPRMQLVRKAAEQYQRLILDCTRPTLAIHQQQVNLKKKNCQRQEKHKKVNTNLPNNQYK